MSELKRVGAVAGTTRTTLLTCPAGKQIVTFDGTISNKRSDQAAVLITLEVQHGATWYVIIKDAPVAYYSSFKVPKLVMAPTDVLAVTCSSADSSDVIISYVEK